MKCYECEEEVSLYNDKICVKCNYDIYQNILVPLYNEIKEKILKKELIIEVISQNISKLKKGTFKDDNILFVFSNFIPSVLIKHVNEFLLKGLDEFLWLYTNNCLSLKYSLIEKVYNYPEEINDIFNLIKDLNTDSLTPDKISEKYFEFGNIYYAKNCFEEAANDCSKAIKINPNYYEAYINRGAAYARQQLYYEALLDFTKAIELNSQSKEAYFNRGITYMKNGDFKKAVEDLKNSADLGYNDAKQVLKIHFNIKI